MKKASQFSIARETCRSLEASDPLAHGILAYGKTESIRDMPRCRLYLVTPPQIDARTFLPKLVEALDGGDVACVQLRMKGADDDLIRKTCCLLRPLAQERGVAFILNDRADLAANLECDGVHIGQDDCPYSQARHIIGPDKIVGVTCHNSRHLAMVAAEEGADYVAFGAFFPSNTKDVTFHADPSLLQWWNDLMIVPSVAIGGVTVENGEILVRSGADFIAVCQGVWNYPRGPGVAVRDFNRLLDDVNER